MKRLKKIAQTYTYELATTGVYREYDCWVDDEYDSVWKIDSTFEYFDDLEECIAKDSDINFVEYMDYGDYAEVAKKLESITLGFRAPTLITTVVAKEELTDEDKDIILDYMTGQFSDGWGEGFEQHPIYEFSQTVEVEDEEYDEETDETHYYTYDESHPFEVTVSWWDGDKYCKSTWLN